MENLLNEVNQKIEQMREPKSTELMGFQLRVANQVDNIVHGSSTKFPCATEEEKVSSLKALLGVFKLIEESIE